MTFPGRGATRLAAMVGATAGAIVLFTPVQAQAKIRLAVSEFRVEGEGTPALALQLQDGFVLGLVRAGIQVFDPVDVRRRLEATPELAGCDSSACLKNIGHLLAVSYVVRVKIDVAGNSYKMVARLFSTEGATPAALPISTKSRTCDVCTVAEARDYMFKLADALRLDLQDPSPAPVAPTPPPAPPPPPPSLVLPLVAAMGGAIAIGIGVALFVTMPDCHATSVPTCDDNRLRSAVAGGLIGAGGVTSAVGTTVIISRSRMTAPARAPGAVTAVSLSIPF
jgi:hypothetical protein